MIIQCWLQFFLCTHAKKKDFSVFRVWILLPEKKKIEGKIHQHCDEKKNALHSQEKRQEFLLGIFRWCSEGLVPFDGGFSFLAADDRKIFRRHYFFFLFYSVRREDSFLFILFFFLGPTETTGSHIHTGHFFREDIVAVARFPITKNEKSQGCQFLVRFAAFITTTDGSTHQEISTHFSFWKQIKIDFL